MWSMLDRLREVFQLLYDAARVRDLTELFFSLTTANRAGVAGDRKLEAERSFSRSVVLVLGDLVQVVIILLFTV